jgi:hypothetical protein
LIEEADLKYAAVSKTSFKEKDMRRAIKLQSGFFLGSLLLIIVFVLWTPTVNAQCGSESSSCKDCHEVQGELSVNNDGTGWHESHAFGDFCHICHAGNLQATEADAAHLGMVAPLEDIEASCQSCHPNDLMERAQVYAVTLGIEIGGSASNPTLVTAPINTDLATLVTTPIHEEAALIEQAAVVPVAEQATACPVIDTQLAVDDPNLVDYAQRYNEIVLGERPINWGNITLIGMIGLVVLGGGSFVIFNEVRLSRLSRETVKIEGEYPADVVEMLPDIVRLKPQTRKTLENILNNPEKTDKVLGLIDAAVSDEETEE